MEAGLFHVPRGRHAAHSLKTASGCGLNDSLSAVNVFKADASRDGVWMAAEPLPNGRLREFLEPLTRHVRTQLLGELERSLLRGDAMPRCELVLNELRRLMSRSGEPLPRVGNPPRLFFRTFEPFLVNDNDRHRPGKCISRASLMPLWGWICEHLMPAQAETFCREVSKALLSGYADKAARLARDFQDYALRRMQEILAAAIADESVAQRVAREIGTPRGLADLRGVIDILKARDALEALRALAEIEGVIDKIKANPKDPGVGWLLKNIPNAARALPSQLDVPLDSPWGRQLIAIRAELSDRVKREIELLPERTRYLLGPRPTNSISKNSSLDEREVAEVEVLIDFARVCGAYAAQLRIQDTIWQAFSELRADLKAVKQPLLAELRNATTADRRFRQSQVAAAVTISAKVFDDDYAQQFAQAAGLQASKLRSTVGG
jgi:hypothetical protein